MFGRNHDLPCQRCKHIMTGVNNYELRRICEDCGGNKTKYNKNKPHPEKPKEKK